MLKFGVECGCARGDPSPGTLVKLASGQFRCECCGATYNPPVERPVVQRDIKPQK